MSKEHAKPAGRIVNIDGRDRRPWALQTRDKILNAAVEEIAERGFERARLVDIAERAGVTVGSIYTWYRDKTDLFTAALDHAIEEQRSNNERILSRRDGSIDPKFDTELLAMMFMALPVGLSALNLAGLERPRDLHWIAVYEAFRQALLPRASTD
ncbi:MAG: TetR/AcrR family transcriptional regulator [Actinobacteria bacterium]|nr:TetR/AcrR family transcriptional regulator [Actinomycetota bacterium]